MVDAGKDLGLDLTSGYYDAGDNFKFNFPQASAITLFAWSGVDFADGYKKAGQYEYLLDAVKCGSDYLIKCHSGKNELYVQVGNGNIDHGDWVAPEYMQYEYPSYKIEANLDLMLLLKQLLLWLLHHYYLKNQIHHMHSLALNMPLKFTILLMNIEKAIIIFLQKKLKDIIQVIMDIMMN